MVGRRTGVRQVDGAWQLARQQPDQLFRNTICKKAYQVLMDTGDSFGEIALLMLTPRTATCQAPCPHTDQLVLFNVRRRYQSKILQSHTLHLLSHCQSFEYHFCHSIEPNMSMKLHSAWPGNRLGCVVIKGVLHPKQTGCKVSKIHISQGTM